MERTMWRPVSRREVRRRALAGAVGIGLVAASIGMTALVASSPAEAAPGAAGTPQVPVVLFEEDFENGAGTAPTPLTEYVGVSGQRYTADRAWLESCNGNIVSMSVPVAQLGSCTRAASSASTRQLAYALGVHGAAADPRSNDAVTAYTDRDPGAGAIELQTSTNIPLPEAKGRFLAFSVDTAAVNCRVSAPRYQFSLLDESGSPVSVGAEVDACASGKSVDVPGVGPLRAGSVIVGSYTSNGSLLFDGSSLGIRIRNANGSGDGNDSAFDNLRVLDVTPQLDKAFSPATVMAGETSTLTFTITNTSELAAKDGWSFTDSLPDGLVVAAAPATSTTCEAGAVEAPPGAGAVRVRGDLSAGMRHCTVSVDVVADAAGRYANGRRNVAAIGLNPPAEATLTVRSPGLGLVKHAGAPTDIDDDGLTDEGDTIAYTFTLTNTGDVPLSGLTVSDPKAGEVTCPQEPLAPGASATCAAAEPYTVTAADVDAGSVDNTATASAAPPSGPRVDSAPSTTRTPTTAAAPALKLEKHAALDGAEVAGQTVTYSFDVANTGNVALADLRIVETAFSGTGELGVIECPEQELAPSVTMTCTAEYLLTQDDVDAQKVTNTAVAEGAAPGGVLVASSPSTAELPLTPTAALALVKSANRASSAAVAPGEEIRYTFTLTNTGAVTLHDLTVVEGDFSGTGDRPSATCEGGAAAALAPGDRIVCSATYAVTPADIDAGSVTNTATSTATTAGGGTVVSEPSTAHVVLPATPPTGAVPTATPTPTPVSALASTGSSLDAGMAGGGVALMALGLGLVVLLGRRSLRD